MDYGANKMVRWELAVKSDSLHPVLSPCDGTGENQFQNAAF